MEQTFADFIEKERERLARQREDVLARRRKLDDELAEIDRELNAIAAYEAAKRGTPARAPRRTRGKRQIVLEEVKKHPEGITRGQLLETMGMQDKQGAQFVSNALSHFKRQGQMRLENGRYTAL
jgi:hypothetical protein